jgi:hypothetical protein
MELFTFTGVALLALLVMVLPALAHKQHWNVIREDWRYPLRLVFGVLNEELGAVTVTYYVRGGNTLINGSTTAPTAAQASQVMKQSAIVVFGVAGDIATALFTHNWGLDASAPGYYEPEVIMEPLTNSTSWPAFSFYRVNSNVLQVMRPTTDAASTILVTLRRPHSMGQ